jgi:hypothetical protein
VNQAEGRSQNAEEKIGRRPKSVGQREIFILTMDPSTLLGTSFTDDTDFGYKRIATEKHRGTQRREIPSIKS